jgi:ABC-2 type transport system permease protein
MSATTDTAAVGSTGAMLSHADQAPGGTTLRSANALAVRGLRAIRRLPSAFLPAMMMPIFQAIAFSGTFFAITQIPGFPTDRSINWYLPLACLMGSGFSGLGLGFTAIRDLESGFFDRLLMAPTPRPALILGPLLACWARVTIVVTVVVLVGFAFGARLEGGPMGLVTLAVACYGMSTIAAGWGLGLAFRFKDMRGAALMQLTLFLCLFLTEAQAPLSIMTGWLHTVARINPFNNILRLAREGWLGPVSWDNSWGGVVAIIGIGSLTLGFAFGGLRRLTK